MSGKFGVKATEEVLVLVKTVALSIIAEVSKDGYQMTDLLAFLKSPELEKSLAPVVKDLTMVPAELTELDVWDDIELGKFAYGIVQELVGALKTVVKK